MRRLTLLLFLLPFLYSCNYFEKDSTKKKLAHLFKGYDTVRGQDPLLLPQDNGPSLNVPVSVGRAEGLDIKDMVDSVHYVRLATSNNYLIGHVDRIFIHKDRIIILDRYKARGVFIYDLHGNFLNKIQRIGRGPGEYIEVTDAAVNYAKNEITIFDQRGRHLLFYDLDGKFISDRPVYFQFVELAYLPDGNAVLLNYSLPNFHMKEIANYNLFIVDKDLKVRYKACTFDYEKDLAFRTFGKNHLTNIENEVYFTPRYKDSVLAIHSTGCEGKYALDFGARKIPPSFWQHPDDLQFRSFMEIGDREIFGGVFSITSQAVFFQAMSYGKDHYIFYFPKSRKTASCSFFTGSSRELLTLPAPITSYKDKFLSIIYPADIIKLKDDKRVIELMKDKTEDLKHLINSLNASDNPVLLFFSMKAPK